MNATTPERPARKRGPQPVPKPRAPGVTAALAALESTDDPITRVTDSHLRISVGRQVLGDRAGKFELAGRVQVKETVTVVVAPLADQTVRVWNVHGEELTVKPLKLAEGGFWVGGKEVIIGAPICQFCDRGKVATKSGRCRSCASALAGATKRANRANPPLAYGTWAKDGGHVGTWNCGRCEPEPAEYPFSHTPDQMACHAVGRTILRPLVCTEHPDRRAFTTGRCSSCAHSLAFANRTGPAAPAAPLGSVERRPMDAGPFIPLLSGTLLAEVGGGAGVALMVAGHPTGLGVHLVPDPTATGGNFQGWNVQRGWAVSARLTTPPEGSAVLWINLPHACQLCGAPELDHGISVPPLPGTDRLDTRAQPCLGFTFDRGATVPDDTTTFRIDCEDCGDDFQPVGPCDQVCAGCRVRRELLECPICHDAALALVVGDAQADAAGVQGDGSHAICMACGLTIVIDSLPPLVQEALLGGEIPTPPVAPDGTPCAVQLRAFVARLERVLNDPLGRLALASALQPGDWTPRQLEAAGVRAR